MTDKVLKVGVMSFNDYKRRTIAIAKGEYRPGKGELKIWFESVQSMARVLSNENQELLKTIKYLAKSFPVVFVLMRIISIKNIRRNLLCILSRSLSVFPPPLPPDFQRRCRLRKGSAGI